MIKKIRRLKHKVMSAVKIKGKKNKFSVKKMKHWFKKPEEKKESKIKVLIKKPVDLVKGMKIWSLRVKVWMAE